MDRIRIPAPKPDNWDDLVQAWNDPAAFHRARNAYYEQVRRQREAAAAALAPRDITEPLHTKDDA